VAVESRVGAEQRRRPSMERPNPPFLLAIVGEEEETNPQYQKTWHREINPKLGLDLLKLL
jgi:hypothetical protein